MRIFTSLWLFSDVVVLTACVQTQLAEKMPLIRVPMGIGYGISDVLCEEVKNTSIPKRLEELESVASDFEGVEKCFAIQAGREVRIMVEPDNVDDVAASSMARDIVNKIDKNLEIELNY